MEIWWDSSPLVFQAWVKKMVDAAPPAKQAVLEEQLNRIYVVNDPAQSLVRGCTTNPPLSLTAVKSDLSTWNEWVDDLIRSNGNLSRYEYFWLTYKEVIRRGAEMMLPIWKASGGRFGYISGQLDPRLITESEKMIEMAKEIRAISPNVMIKVPASTQGVDVVRALTAMAIPTNVTTCFTLPQIWAVANAAKEGVAIAEKNKVDLSKWRAVITMMIGRLTEHPVLDQQAARRGITLSWSDKHWLGIYIFRKAFKLLKENALPSKMLACSMRDGPLVGGKYHFWDVEKIAGDIVYTMPPYVLEPLFQKCEDLTFREEILNDDVPPKVLRKMSKIPFVLQSWDENGMEVDQFNLHPSTIATADAFSQASAGLEAYVGERMAVVKK
jgi:transaldolase